MSDIISNAIKLGSVVFDPKYVKTMEEIEDMGDAPGYPDVFPLWCTTNNSLYVCFKTVEGVVVSDINSLVMTTEKAVWYPIVNPSTNLISWEARVLSTDAPDPVTLSGFDGKSAYQIWLDQGNTGSEEDFLKSLEPDFSDLSEEQISNLKTALGLDDLETTLTEINQTLADILG